MERNEGRCYEWADLATELLRVRAKKHGHSLPAMGLRVPRNGHAMAVADMQGAASVILQ